MLMFPGDVERTMSQWTELLGSAGLKIVDVYTENESIELAIEVALVDKAEL